MKLNPMPSNRIATVAEQVIPRTIWIPFLFLVIETTKGLWLYQLITTGGSATDIDPIEANYVGSPLERIMLSAVILLGIFAMRKRFDRVIDFAKKNYLLLLFLLYLLISVAWSDFKVISFKRWVRGFGLLTMIALVFTEDNPLRCLIRLLEMLLIFLLVGSAILIFCFPNLGKETWVTGEVYWVGLATHKNMLGQYGAVGSLFFLWRFLYGGEIKKILSSVPLFALSVLILWGAHSFTSAAVACLGMLLLVFFNLSGRFGKTGQLATITIALALVSAGLLLQNNVLPPSQSLESVILNAGGKDESFTGRTEIWHLTLNRLDLKSIVVGAGYEAFWLGPKAERIRQLTDFETFSAHNGYLEMFLQLGLMGLLLLGLLLARTSVSIFQCRKDHFDLFALWSAFFVVSLVSNIFESNFTNSADLNWILTLIAGINPKCFRVHGAVPEAAEAPDLEGVTMRSLPG